MNVKANRANLKRHSRKLLGALWTPERETALIRECLSGFVRHYWLHESHDWREHLERIDPILGTYGVEGMLLGAGGVDCAATCQMRDVVLDVMYCNTGDTYAMTSMYVSGELRIGDWGSLVEELL